MEALLLSSVVRRRTEAQLLARAARHAQRDQRQVRPDPRTLVVHVSEGRWAADCPGCGAGIAIHPEWTSAPCLGDGCYRVYASIAVPSDWREIEAVLDRRDRINQNMRPGETVADLEAENAANGVLGRP